MLANCIKKLFLKCVLIFHLQGFFHTIILALPLSFSSRSILTNFWFWSQKYTSDIASAHCFLSAFFCFDATLDIKCKIISLRGWFMCSTASLFLSSLFHFLYYWSSKIYSIVYLVSSLVSVVDNFPLRRNWKKKKPKPKPLPCPYFQTLILRLPFLRRYIEEEIFSQSCKSCLLPQSGAFFFPFALL